MMMYLKESAMDFIKQMKNMIFKKTFSVPCGGNKKMNKSRVVLSLFHFNSSPSFDRKSSAGNKEEFLECSFSICLWVERDSSVPSLVQYSAALLPTAADHALLSVFVGA